SVVLVAAVYYLWIERNTRIFQNKFRSIEEICVIIKDYVKLRLLSLKIKWSKQSMGAAKMWKFHVVQGNDGNCSGGYSPHCHLPEKTVDNMMLDSEDYGAVVSSCLSRSQINGKIGQGTKPDTGQNHREMIR
ncbi:hypothetical protein Tco_1341209, partial [Tanacetum coccineum]